MAGHSKHLAILLCATVFGCSSEATQLVFTIDSDLQAGSELGAVQVRRIQQGEVIEQTRFTLKPDSNSAGFTLPLSFAVVPPGGDIEQQVHFEIAALGADLTEELFIREIITGFRQGKSLMVPVFLSGDCVRIASMCKQEETCTEAGCQSPVIEVDTLNEVSPGGELLETIRDPTRFPPQTDAGTAATQNTPPTTPQVSLSSTTARTADTVTVNIDVASVDADNDDIAYRYRWVKNGMFQALPQDGTLAPSLTNKNDVWRVEVVATDGKEDSPGTATATVTIINTTPEIRLSLTSTMVRSSDKLVANLELLDADNDELSLSTTWVKNSSITRSSTSTQPGMITLTPTIDTDDLTRGDSWSIQVAVTDGEATVESATSSVTIQNGAPQLTSVNLVYTGPRPQTTSQLQIQYSASDKDPGDTIERVVVEWLIDDQLISEFDGLILPSSQTQKGQRIRARVRAFDDRDEASNLTETNEVLIENTPPVIVQTDILPSILGVTTSSNTNCLQEPCSAENDFVCTPTAHFDADGDPVVYRYNWYQNDLLYNLFTPFAEISGQNLGRGMVVFCTVEPFDGEDAGALARSPSIYIDNATPTFTQLAVSPTSPREGQTVTASVSGWYDADGDPEQYRYEWYVNGVEQTPTRETLGSEYFDKGDAIRVKVVALDIIGEGQTTWSSTITAANTVPSLGLVRISPNVAVTTTLVSADALGWRDPDPSDLEDYRYEWHVNNQLVPGANTETLNPSNFSKGDTVFARVAPYDGESLGIAVDSAVMVIQNTAPQPPGVSIAPAAPLSTEDLSCQVNNPSVDADQDPITYTYRWRRDGALTTITSSIVTSSATDELEVWTCEATPFDGEATGFPGSAATIIRRTTSSLAPGAIHASGGNTCIIQRSPAGLLCWDAATVWPFVAGDFSSFINTPGMICARNDQDQLICPDASGTPTIIDISSHWASEDIEYSGTGFGFCYLESNGEVTCTDPTATVPAGPYTALSGGNGFGCGIRQSDQTIRCWGNNGNNNATPPAGAFLSIKTGYWVTEAARTDGEIIRWGTGNISFGRFFTPESPNIIKTSQGVDGNCILELNGEAHCTSFNGIYDGLDRVPDLLFSDIAVGERHACGVANSGQVHCWGNRQAPVQVSASGNQGLTLTKVVVGDRFACGLEASGQMACWGNVDTNTLPNESGLYALGGEQIYQDLWAQGRELCARRNSGEIDCFGERFQKVKQLAAASGSISSNADGASNLLLFESGSVLKTDGMWLSSRHYQGCDKISHRIGGDIFACLTKQNIVHMDSGYYGGADFSSGKFVDISTGEVGQYCFVREDGGLSCSGHSPPAPDPANPFTQVSISTAWREGAGCALTQNGSITCWSSLTAPSYDPQNPVLKIMCGHQVCAALHQDGSLSGWGSGSWGANNPPALDPLNPFIDFSLNRQFGCALRQDRSAVCWGRGDNGQTTVPAFEPGLVPEKISTGLLHACVLFQSGDFKCWGNAAQIYNFEDFGQVLDEQNRGFAFSPGHHCSLRSNDRIVCKGDNDFGQSSPPTGTFSRVFARTGLSCGIRPNGAAECWGQNDDFQLNVPAGYNFIELGMGARHACGIATNTSTTNIDPNAGGIVCWGYNGDGRGDIPTPVRHDYTDVDCRDDHCCALNGDGELQCFGIGINAGTPAGSGYTQLVYHENGGCVLSASGLPTCWGDAAPNASVLDNYPPVYVTP